MKNISRIIMTLMIIASIITVSEAQTNFTKKVGGDKGTSFMLPSSRQAILSNDRITGIAIQHGRRVEQIELEYSIGKGFSLVEHIGNDAGEWSYIKLEPGEFITYITGQAGTLIDQITFHTSLRRSFGPYGGSGGQYFEITVPSDAMVIGFTGKIGPSINQIGLIYRTANKGHDISKYQHRGTYYDPTVEKNVGEHSKRINRDHRNKKAKNNSMKNQVKGLRINQSPFTIRDSVAIYLGDGSTHNIVKKLQGNLIYHCEVNSPSTPPGVPIPYPNISTVKDKKSERKIIVKK